MDRGRHEYLKNGPVLAIWPFDPGATVLSEGPTALLLSLEVALIHISDLAMWRHVVTGVSYERAASIFCHEYMFNMFDLTPVVVFDFFLNTDKQ
jgi:hypothetical protein